VQRYVGTDLGHLILPFLIAVAARGTEQDAVAEIVDDLSGHEDIPGPAHEVVAGEDEHLPLAQMSRFEESLRQTAEQLPEQWRTGKPVLCVPGLGLLDEAVALMVAHLVERQGIGARAEQADALSMSRIFTLDTKDVAPRDVYIDLDMAIHQLESAMSKMRAGWWP
jgi:hypothetical protein